MLMTLQGVYRNGKVELSEQPCDVADDTRVIVTFLERGPIDLRAHGIGESEAAELRARLAPFAQDWDSPEMNAYDNYDAVRTKP